MPRYLLVVLLCATLSLPGSIAQVVIESEQIGELPEAVSGESARKLEVGAAGVPIDGLGPIIIETDGSISRVKDWTTFSEAQQAAISKKIVARNKERLGALQARAREQDAHDSTLHVDGVDDSGPQTAESLLQQQQEHLAAFRKAYSKFASGNGAVEVPGVGNLEELLKGQGPREGDPPLDYAALRARLQQLREHTASIRERGAKFETSEEL